MKNQTFLFVIAIVLLVTALVGGILIFSRNTSLSQPGPSTVKPSVTPSVEEESPTLPEKEEPSLEKVGEGALSTKLADQVGGERSGQVVVTVDPFTEETSYTINVSNLTAPQSPASYQVWVQTPQGVMGSLGEIKIESDGTGVLETPGSKPEAGWSVVVTYQEDETPTPGKRVLMGTLK